MNKAHRFLLVVFLHRRMGKWALNNHNFDESDNSFINSQICFYVQMKLKKWIYFNFFQWRSLLERFKCYIYAFILNTYFWVFEYVICIRKHSLVEISLMTQLIMKTYNVYIFLFTPNKKTIEKEKSYCFEFRNLRLKWTYKCKTHPVSYYYSMEYQINHNPCWL